MGLITLRQSMGTEMPYRTVRRRVTSGAWIELFPGVYSIGPGVASPRRTALAATLWLPGSAGSHRYAGAEWDLDCVPPGFVEVTAPHEATHPEVIVHESSFSLIGQTKVHEGVRITDVERTLLDLGRFLHPKQLELALEDACRRGITSTETFEQRFHEWRRQGRTGVTNWRRVLEGRDRAVMDSHTRFERRLMQLIRGSDLPKPRAQFEIYEDDRFVARPDAAYPEFRIAIEAQSVTFHSGREAWERDLRRQTKLAAAGWLVLYFTYRQMTQEPDFVINEIRRALLSRGWVPTRRTATYGS